MSGAREFRFRISEAFTPDTLPMSKLAAYMTDVAVLLGESSGVHFERLERGSVVLVQKIDEPSCPLVKERIRLVKAGNGPADAMTAYRRINNRLASDKGAGVLQDENGAELIEFAGKDAATPITFGAFNQAGSIDGKVIKVGGRQDTVPVHLQAPDRVYAGCNAARPVAKALAQYLFDYDVRVHGTGRWHRTEAGEWELQRFTITHFDVLDGEALSTTVARLRDVPGNEWRDVDDPWQELSGLRGDDETQ